MITDQILNLSAKLGEKLMNRGWKITCAESCTGGGIGYAITSAPGSSNWFERGFITYCNTAKSQMVGVQKNTLNEHGAVSQPVVQQMSEGAAKEAKANVSVAVSGVAGPGGGSDEKPVGLVWFGFVIGQHVFQEKQIFDGDRNAVREQSIMHAMDRILEQL